MKKIVKILFMLSCMVLLVGNTAIAAELDAVMNGYTCPDSVVLFVKDQGKNIEQVYLGNDEAREFTVEETGSVRTIIVLDNSLSINKKYRETIKTFLADIVASRRDGDTFTIATFAENITYLVQESNDYLEIKRQIDQLEFVNQDSYFVNAMYTVMNDISSYEETKYTRVIVIADGVDNEALGYTDEELYQRLQTVKVPIYAVGCRGEEENLKKMFALSRSSNGKSYLLDDASGTEIIQELAGDREVLKLRIVPQDKCCDGTNRMVRVSFGEDYCVAELAMPFKAAEEAEETVEETTESVEETMEETQETQTGQTEPQAEKETGDLTGRLLMILGGIFVILVIIAGVAVIMITKAKKPKEEKKPIDLSVIGHSSNTAIVGRRTGDTEILGGAGSRSQGNKTEIIAGHGPMKLFLQDMGDPSRTFEYPLRGKILIGRDSTKCQIVIGYSQYISAVHCEIIVKGSSLSVRDGGGDVIASTNGTFVNEQKAAPELPLPSGAILRLGQVKFKVTYR